MNNNIRFDLSNYLIHFFRNVDLSGSSPINFPEHMGWHNICEDTCLPAFFLLRAALRNGRLWATWSYRNDVRTIYGPYPAICFTEMPIAAFLEAGQARQEIGQAMSPFGLVFPKNRMFQLGARPVISGLSNNTNVSATKDVNGARLLYESTLPLHEQYRYVTFNLSNSKNIDWTHEREWRWPGLENMHDFNSQSEEDKYVENWYDIPGLDLYQVGITGMGVIVKTEEQADLIVRDILSLIDNGQAHKHAFSFVLVSNRLPPVFHLHQPEHISHAITEAMIDLTPYFLNSTQHIDHYNNKFSQYVKEIENNMGRSEYGEFGGCWLWLHDNKDPLTRALLAAGRVFVTAEGRYLAQLYEFSDSRSLRERQAMTTQLATIVQTKFKVSCCYFSVLNSDNPMDTPFYAGHHNTNISFYNHA